MKLRAWELQFGTGLVLLALLWGPRTLQAQANEDPINRQVCRAFHGPDGAGKDGPMAPIGRDLIRLYYAYRTYREAGHADSVRHRCSHLLIRDTLVAVDAIADGEPAALLHDLKALGMKEASKSERLVSGLLPMHALRKAAQLSTLESMKAAVGATDTSGFGEMSQERGEGLPDIGHLDSTSHSAPDGFRINVLNRYTIGGLILLVLGVVWGVIRASYLSI